MLGWIYARALIKNEKLWGGPAPITLVAARRLHPVGHRRHHRRRPHRLCAVLQPAVLRRSIPPRSFELWKGGMSFHGGFLGCVAAVMLFARRNDISDPVARRHHHRGRRRSACSSGGSPISSTASCGAGRRIPACPGRWCFPTAGRCRAIRASSTRQALEGILLFTILAVMIRMGALKRPGLILGSFIAIYGLRALPANSSGSPTRSSDFCGAG